MASIRVIRVLGTVVVAIVYGGLVAIAYSMFYPNVTVASVAIASGFGFLAGCWFNRPESEE